MGENVEFTQVELENAMYRAVQMGEDIVLAIRERGEAFERAEARYRTAKAEAMLRQREGTVAQQEARAIVDTEDLLFDRGIARALLESAKEAGRANREGQATLRSLNANLRDQV